MGPMTKLCISLKDFLEKPLARRARLVALAFATMLNLQTLPLGGRLLGLQNGENFSHLTESEKCESFPRFHNLSIKQKNIVMVRIGLGNSFPVRGKLVVQC